MRLFAFFSLALAGCTSPLIVDCTQTNDPACPDAGVDGGPPVLRDAGIHFDADPPRPDANVDAGPNPDASADAGPCVFFSSEVPGDVNDRDEDCDGERLCFVNDDGDDYRTTDTVRSVDGCDGKGEAYDAKPAGDCRDDDASIHPGALEIADNGVDEDCDTLFGCYYDFDNDGHSRDDGAVQEMSTDTDCDDPGEGNASEPRDDCADTLPTIHRGATEVAGDMTDTDENCDGVLLCFEDLDLDGFGSNETREDTDGDCTDLGEARASAGVDCDDTTGTRNPGLPEMFGNGVDENCDAMIECFADADSDGYRHMLPTFSVVSSDADCDDPGEGSTSEPATDCADTDASVSPGDLEIADNGIDDNCNGSHGCYWDRDDDGYRLPDQAVRDESTNPTCVDEQEATAGDPATDCNDVDALVFPSAPERPDNGLDDDCDGSFGCYYDADNDGFSRSDLGVRDDSVDTDCADAGEGASTEPRTDCNDTDGDISPMDPEIIGDAGDVDENCDGRAGCFRDMDDDTYRTNSTLTSTDGDCADALEAYFDDDAFDCDDSDPLVHPGAIDLADNGLDDDCDGLHACYIDMDNDGFRTTSGAVSEQSSDSDCSDAGEGSTGEPATDCNDGNMSIRPGATEICDNTDNNCSSSTDEGCDDDNDNYCDAAMTRTGTPTTCTAVGGDCVDTNSNIHPGHAEVADNGVDDNCNGLHGCWVDIDRDTFNESNSAIRDDSTDADCNDPGEGLQSRPRTDCNDNDPAINPNATEIPGNGIDEDCNPAVTDARRPWNEALAMCVCPGDVTSS